MAISHAIPATHEFHIRYGAVDSVATAPNTIGLTDFGIHPSTLLSFNPKYDETDIPEGHGALDTSDGYIGASTIPLRGKMYGTDPNDTLVSLAARMNLMAVATPQTYLLMGLYNGTTKLYYRRYGKILSPNQVYDYKTQFTVTGFEMDFRVLDPFLYYNVANSKTINLVSATTNTSGSTDTGIARSKRLTITIIRTGAGATTNPTVANTSGQSFQITGSLATAGDYWTIDMYTGKVTKTVSGVTSNDKANFAGQFWGIRHATDSLTCTSTVSTNASYIFSWLERRM